jgi:hypothetical protein
VFFLDFQAFLEIFKAIFRDVLSCFIYGCFICEKNVKKPIARHVLSLYISLISPGGYCGSSQIKRARSTNRLECRSTKQKTVSRSSLMPKFCQPPNKFIFVHQKLINETQLKQPRHLWDDLATRLKRGIYWVQPNGKGGSRC